MRETGVAWFRHTTDMRRICGGTIPQRLETHHRAHRTLVVCGWGVLSANAVTVIGSVLSILVALLTGVTGWLFWGAFMLTILVLFDSLDGSVAALSGGGTRFGAFLDSTLDRIADWATLAGIILYVNLHSDFVVRPDGDVVPGLHDPVHHRRRAVRNHDLVRDLLHPRPRRIGGL